MTLAWFTASRFNAAGGPWAKIGSSAANLN